MSDQGWQQVPTEVNELALINALQSDFTTVHVQFLKDEPRDGRFPNTSEFGDKLYTYKVPLHWNVMVNDWIVVLVSSSFKAVRVTEVHSFPQPHSAQRTKWAVQKIDASFYFAVGEAEEQMLRNLHNLRKQRERDALLAELRRTIPGDLLDQSMQQMATLVSGGRFVQQQAALGTVAEPRIDLSAQVAAAEQQASQPPVQQAAEQPAQAGTLQPGVKPSWAQ